MVLIITSTWANFHISKDNKECNHYIQGLQSLKLPVA
jgi:hypothetical protein